METNGVDSTPDFQLMLQILSKVPFHHFGDGRCTFDVASSPAEIRVLDKRGRQLALILKADLHQSLETALTRLRGRYVEVA